MTSAIRTTARSFTHVDPFEDTERSSIAGTAPRATSVSPTSIRSRILKAEHAPTSWLALVGFTHVDPFEDTESGATPSAAIAAALSFTHVDPFEDTESY